MKNHKSPGTGSINAGRILLGLIFIVGGFYALISILFYPETKNIVLTISLFLGAFSLVAAIFLCRRWWLFVIAAALLITGCCFAGIEWYDSSIKIDDTPNWREWRPNIENSRVVHLEDEASLKLTEDLPRMDGATALYPVYAAFAAAVYPEDAITYQVLDCSTTAWAYEKIVDGDCDIVFCAAPSQAQVDYAREKGVELVFTPIGKEAFVFYVNAKNPLENVSIADIRGIWSGKITRWDELGVGKLGAIRPFQREEGSGSQSTFVKLMGDTPIMEPEQEDVIGDMGGVIRKTADYRNYKNAIGYSFRFYATVMNPNVGIRLLSVNGVSPTRENIENGSYPLADCFYAVTRLDADDNTRALLEWICGPQGQALVEMTGYTGYAEK